MISRVADHAFWFGRYLERAEAVARVLSVTHAMALDAELSPAECWLPVVIVAGEEERFDGRATNGEHGDAAQAFMTWEHDNPASLVRSVQAARDNSRSIREVVSLEAWEAVNELYLWLHGAEARALYDEHRYDFYRRVRREVQLALGLLRSTMLHDTQLDFIWMGVLLERSGQTARALDVHHHALRKARTHPEVEVALWLTLLRACSGFEPFMKRHRGQVSASAVASFLMLEPRFPRSLRYCIDEALGRFHAIRPPHQPDLPGARANARFEALHRWIREITPSLVAEKPIHDLLTHVVDETARIGADIGEELFGYGSG